MGVVTRADSRYFWLNLERAGRPPIREATRIVAKGLPPGQLREHRRLAEQVYYARMADLARQKVGLPLERDRATFRYYAAWYLKHVTPTKRSAVRERSTVVIAALDTLVRLSDLAKLKWAQDHGSHLEIHDPKAAPYVVPVSKRLRIALDELPKSSAYVFAHHARTRTGPPSAALIAQAFRFGCYAAGLQYGRPDGLTFHCLRHTAATRALAVPGTSLKDVQTLGGWRDIKSMARYIRPSGVDQALVDRMSRARRQA